MRWRCKRERGYGEKPYVGEGGGREHALATPIEDEGIGLVGEETIDVFMDRGSDRSPQGAVEQKQREESPSSSCCCSSAAFHG